MDMGIDVGKGCDWVEAMIAPWKWSWRMVIMCESVVSGVDRSDEDLPSFRCRHGSSSVPMLRCRHPRGEDYECKPYGW
jgi:hypothetical protein